MENVSRDLRRLNTWSQVGGPVWGALGGEAVIQEVCHWGQALRSKSLLPVWVQVVSSQLPVPATMSTAGC